MTITTKTCWCGAPATMTVPIDPEVTPWDGELRQTDGSPATYSCDEHGRDGYERLAEEDEFEEGTEGPFQLGSWTPGQLAAVRQVAEENAEEPNAALVAAIDAELQAREARAQAFDTLARLLLQSEDFAEDLEVLAALPEPVWTELAERVEACPVHVCDVHICEDDQNPGCPAGRQAAERVAELGR